MKNVRENEEMLRNGFMIIPFPAELCQKMLDTITIFIHNTTEKDSKNITENVMSLSDEAFENKFLKSFRMFPANITKLLVKWVEVMAPFLGGAQTGINYVSSFEIKQNPLLTEHSFDAFWRCVRPGKPDVGAAHRDYQFWEILKGTPQEPKVPFDYDERWKIWIPLFGCNKKNSLQIIPGSHNEEIPISLLETKNGLKPCIEKKWLLINEKRFVCPLEKFSNSCILFHDLLVHQGVSNLSSELRISAELTILLKLNPVLEAIL